MPAPRSSRNSLAIAVVLLSTAAVAQQAPDSGRLLEEMRPAPSLPQRKAPEIRIEEPAPAKAAGPRVPVTLLRIKGATRFSEAELHALVADSEGKELSLGELRQLAERITQHYREHGYLLARAYLPAQEVRGGEIEIAVLEGRLGQVTVDNEARLGGAALAPLSQLLPGEVVNDEALEKNLLLLSDLPGVEIRSTLRPGATVGASDLLVDVAPGPRIVGSVDADNYGDRFSGQYRLGGTIAFNNPLRSGDQAAVRAVASDEGMNYLRASYQLPVGPWGSRVGVAGSDMRYKLGETLAPLQATGEAQTGSLYVSHPIVRSRVLNLNAVLQYDHLRLGDRLGATDTIVDRTLDNWSAGVSGDFQDGVGGGGGNSFSVLYTDGHLGLDSTTQAIDAITARTEGHFGKLAMSWLRLQRLTDANSLYISAYAQIASRNLDSSQKFSLGGANGVRAYPQNEAPGDEGYLLTIEARHAMTLSWPGLWQLVAFVDTGHVTLNENPWSAAANHRTLSGAGFGLNVAQGRGWAAKASIAWRLTSAGPSSDVDRSPRAWLQAVKYF